MTLPTVSALMKQALAEHYPGMSVSQVERMHRKRRNYVQQWLDNTATIKLPPQHETIYALAEMLKVTSGDLYVAFLRDSTGLDEESELWQSGLSSSEQEILDLYNQVPPEQRHMVFGVLRLFAAGFPQSPSTPSTLPTEGDNNSPPHGVAATSHSAAKPHPDALVS